MHEAVACSCLSSHVPPLTHNRCIDSLQQLAAKSAHGRDALVILVAGSGCRAVSSPAAQHSACSRSAARRRPCYQRRQQTSTHQWRRAARSPARAGTRGRLRDASLPTEAVFRPKLKPLRVNLSFGGLGGVTHGLHERLARSGSMGMSLMWSEPCVASLRLRNEHFSQTPFSPLRSPLPPPLPHFIFRFVSKSAHARPERNRFAITWKQSWLYSLYGPKLASSVE